ncbi:sensor histidine kinase [Cohnella endophytica]|uniref:histidine kinase n=1 Tax=Cohnella endophytica TaxID=2419778 RepID=A0A494XGL8_9BACL|nr:HAMP domain-containing sensor histidine kinase [Cohnella endophytica]RKP48851.1 sensor histidine kinase [Cohnella endophytica]
MRSLRARILLSMALVMLFTVIVTFGFCSSIVYRMLVDQAKNQLLLQLDNAVGILDGGSPDDLEPSDLPLRFKNHQFNAEFYIVDASGKVVAASHDRLVDRPPPIRLKTENGTATLHGYKVRYVSQTMEGYTVVLYAPERLLKRMFREALRIVFASIAVSGLILYVIGFLFIWRITRPIAKLKEAVNRYDPKRGVLPVSKVGATEIDDLMHTLQSMSGRIRNHHENQIEFLQHVSHELRTPLMSIQGYANAIRDQVVTQDKGLAIITEESYRLVRMVDRLLELTRLESPDLPQEDQTVDLNEMAAQTNDLLAASAAERGVAILWNNEKTLVTVPAEQLFQLLINLVQNGIRYAKTEVRIRYGYDREGWFLSVEDDGEGVPEQLRDRIFERYFKGEGGQTGLGLSICRRIAESMQAELKYEPAESGGAKFILVKAYRGLY